MIRFKRGTHHPLHRMDCVVVFKQHFTNPRPSSFVIVHPEVASVVLCVLYCSSVQLPEVADPKLVEERQGVRGDLNLHRLV